MFFGATMEPASLSISLSVHLCTKYWLLCITNTYSFAAIVFNPLPNGKILDQSKLKAFADDNLNVYQKLKFALGRVENIVGKGENAGYQHFLLFPQCFQKASFLGLLKVRIVW